MHLFQYCFVYLSYQNESRTSYLMSAKTNNEHSVWFGLVYLIENGYFQKLMSNSPKWTYLPTFLVTSVQNFICFQPFLYIVVLFDKSRLSSSTYNNITVHNFRQLMTEIVFMVNTNRNGIILSPNIRD